MKNNDKYNIIENLLEKGETDLVFIGREAGSQAEKDKSVRDWMVRYLKKEQTLKLLYEANLEKKDIKPQKPVAENNYKGNDGAIMGVGQSVETWEQLLEMGKDNPIIRLIDERFKAIEDNKNDYEYNNITEGFVLDEKYTDITSDEIVTVSLRMTKSAKKMLDRFAKDNSQYKKVHITSQLIEQKIKEYL